MNSNDLDKNKTKTKRAVQILLLTISHSAVQNLITNRSDENVLLVTQFSKKAFIFCRLTRLSFKT